VAAVISAVAVVGVGLIGFYAGLRTGSLSAPSISMTMPGSDSRISPVTTVSGTAHDLQSRQMVWVFVQFIHPDGAPSGNLYPVLGPCPVGKDGSWTCPGVHVGTASDYGKQYKLWAGIVTDSQAYTYSSLLMSPHAHHWLSMLGGTRHRTLRASLE
jgi:hypothetical protein